MEIELVNVGDLLESPVLFISGKGSMQLTTKQKTVLQQYVNQGGFLFVENACGDAQFDQEFRLLMKELFLTAHWHHWHRPRPMVCRPEYSLGICRSDPWLQTCCRTSIVYVTTDLGCFGSCITLARTPVSLTM